MQRRQVLELAASGAALAILLDKFSGHLGGESPGLSTPAMSSENAIAATIRVDWAKELARTTPFTFGSNDYEITTPEKAADSVFQKHLSELGIGLIRVHHAGLWERWTDPGTKTWDEAKIKAGYDASYPHKPTIIQNIPGWPKWMAQDENGLLDPSEYDNYATFCASLVRILNQRQQRKVRYWEPLNEKEKHYEQAGKLDELWKIYNKVATAMKRQDASIKVGGPALNWDNTGVLAAFLKACASNVDFVSWHRYATGDAKESTDSLMAFTPQYGNQVKEFRAVVRQHIRDRNIPLLLGEYNINYSWDSGETRQNTHIGAVWFASVLKHLAEAGIDMATSWHLKDGIYGMIDPSNNLRPSATVFAWGIKYLIGSVMQTSSDRPFVEALAVRQRGGDRSVLLINKSAEAARVSLHGMPKANRLPMFSLDADGVKPTTLAAALDAEPLTLKPYSLVLLRFS